jgi:uncharacterized membrane-anchored protein YjiN (DUF445 family)
MNTAPTIETSALAGIIARLEARKGDVTLLVSALAYVAAWMLLHLTRYRTAGDIGVAIAEAALIGGLCDYIALKMIFERRWYLPNSGVIPRNRERLIDGIAATIEREWLTPEMIGDRLARMNLVGRLGTYLEEVKVEDLAGRGGIERILNQLIELLESPENRERLENIIRRALPKTFTRIYGVLHSLGADSMGERIAATLRQRLPALRDDPALIETLDNAIHEFGHQLHDRDSYAFELAQRLIDSLVRRAVDSSRGQITLMVRENLANLSDEKIRFQIESKTRTHLDWIRVNGGIFGAFFGLMFAMSRIAGALIAAHLHLGM